MIKQLPIRGGAYKNVDDDSLTNDGAMLMDAFVDETGSTARRPGLSTFLDLLTGRPVDALYYWRKRNRTVAFSNGRMFLVEQSGAFVEVSTTNIATGGKRTKVAESDNYIFMADGGRLKAYAGFPKIGVTTYVGAGDDDLTTDGVPTSAMSVLVEIDKTSEASTGTLTRTSTNVSDGDTVTIGERTYRFKSTIAQIDDVLIGSDATTSMDNIIAAINGSGVEGTTYYTGTTAHADFTASLQDTGNLQFTITANVEGTDYNSVATTEASGQLSWGASSTSGGVDNTFRWSADGSVNWSAEKVSVTGQWQTLTGGVKVKIASKGGHDSGDYWEFAAHGSDVFMISDLSAPAHVSHVAFLDTYMVCNDDLTGRFQYSLVGNELVWSGLDFATAESSPDNIVAVAVANRELVLFGSETVEFWQNDGTTPFSRYGNQIIETGCIAPYSIVFTDNTFYWLNNQRKVVHTAGRAAQVISTPFDREIASFERVDDAYAFTVETAGRHFYVLTFPSEERTLVYDLQVKDWAEWGYWNAYQARHERFLGNCTVSIPEWGVYLTGSRRDGKIYSMSLDNHDDAGDTIKAIRRTGHVTHGGLTRKRSNCLTLRLKRGKGMVDSANPLDTNAMPHMMIRYRNDGGEWQSERLVELGKLGDREFIARLHRNGIYRARQWEFAMTDKAPLVLIDAEEDVEVLR